MKMADEIAVASEQERKRIIIINGDCVGQVAHFLLDFYLVSKMRQNERAHRTWWHAAASAAGLKRGGHIKTPFLSGLDQVVMMNMLLEAGRARLFDLIATRPSLHDNRKTAVYYNNPSTKDYYLSLSL